MEEIKQALGAIRAGAIEISFRGYGFFPTSKAPRVFWVGIGAGPELAALAPGKGVGQPDEIRSADGHALPARGGEEGEEILRHRQRSG